MDFFQGSSPPNFISFCLENYPPEDETMPAGPSQTQPSITRDVVPITIHMPQRTSKILLVRLTANENALLFQIRVTCFARYTV